MNDDNMERQEGAFLLGMLLGASCLAHRGCRPYLENTEELYVGTIHITEGIGYHDGRGHRIVWR